MKKILAILTLTAFAAIPATTFAAKSAAKATPAPAAATPAPKPAEPAAAAPKALGMYVKVDAIDTKAKTFTHTNKDGAVVKFNITATTDIKNGDAPAKLEDIKVGDQVSGSRIKKSPTEYDVVKITKFGPLTPKEKPAAATPAPKKAS